MAYNLIARNKPKENYLSGVPTIQFVILKEGMCSNHNGKKNKIFPCYDQYGYLSFIVAVCFCVEAGIKQTFQHTLCSPRKMWGLLLSLAT